jgi:sugar phosphate isomerase/epimerase
MGEHRIHRRDVLRTGVAAAAVSLVSAGRANAAPAARRNTFAVSMNSYTWGRFDLAECLEQIRRTPIRNVELPVELSRPKCLIPELMVDAPLGGRWQYSFPDLKALLAKDGFQADSVDVFGHTGYAGSEKIIRRRVDFAHRLGAKILVLGCHHHALHDLKPGQETAEQKAARLGIYAILRDVADHAAKLDVKIALEIHGGVTANAAESLRTIREVGRPNLGINFDVANILIYNRQLDAAGAARELEALAPHVFHVHLKDVVREPGGSKFHMPRLGQGEVDFRRAFDILHRAGFYGPFSFEVETFHGATESNDIRDYHKDLVASIEYIRSLGEFSS